MQLSIVSDKVIVALNTGGNCGRTSYNEALLNLLHDKAGLSGRIIRCAQASKVSFALGVLLSNLFLTFRARACLKVSANNSAIFVIDSLVQYHTLPWHQKLPGPLKGIAARLEYFYATKNKCLIFNTEENKKNFAQSIGLPSGIPSVVVWPEIVLPKLTEKITTVPAVLENGTVCKKVLLFSRLTRNKRIKEKLQLLIDLEIDVTVMGRSSDMAYVEELKELSDDVHVNVDEEFKMNILNSFNWITIGDFDEPYGITLAEGALFGCLPIFLPAGNPSLNFSDFTPCFLEADLRLGRLSVLIEKNRKRHLARTLSSSSLMGVLQ